MKVRRPYAFCCIEGGGRISGCGCSKPDHGFATVDVRSPLPGDEIITVDESSSEPAIAEDSSLLADAASWYSDGQIEEMWAKTRELRQKIQQCHEAIESGKFDSWHHRDLYDHQTELREIEKTISEARP